MGCCNSKEKQPKAPVIAAAKPTNQTTVKVETKNENISAEAPKENVTILQEENKRNADVQRRLNQVIAAKNSQFTYGKCTIEGGEVSSFFPPKGLCFRIIRDNTWFFYNDTLNYEMHVTYYFSPDSNITPATRTTATRGENDWTMVSAIVYPLETIEFISGTTSVYKTDVTAQALSQQFYKNIQILTGAAIEQLRQVQELAIGSSDEEAILRRCIETNTPFVDLSFIPCEKMLSRAGIDYRKIPITELRRPSEYLENNKVNNIDIMHGAVIPQCIDAGLLGDKWLMSAAAALAENSEYIKQLFANTTEEEKKLGAYRVLINKHGWWNSVLVDDFLPTINNIPCYARSLDDNSELWISLLQKAYAKLHGSYASITGGDALLALRDFTGAPTFRMDKILEKAKENKSDAEYLLNSLLHHAEVGNMILLSTPSGKNIEKCTEFGLKDGCTYYLESIERFDKFGITMLKLRNPWELQSSFTGPWSKESNEWKQYSEITQKLNPNFTQNDGTFYMEWQQAAEVFDGCGIVYYNISKPAVPIYDYRVRGDFEFTQPSVVLMIHAVQPVEVFITLSQKDKRGLSKTDNETKLAPIMLCVSRAENNNNNNNNLQRVECCSSSDPETPATTPTYIIARDVAIKYTFEPSKNPYFIIPRIHRGAIQAGQHREFVIGLRSCHTPLEGKLNIQFTKLSNECGAFMNSRRPFIIENTTEVIRPLQKWSGAGNNIITDADSTLCTAEYQQIKEEIKEIIIKEEEVVNKEEKEAEVHELQEKEDSKKNDNENDNEINNNATAPIEEEEEEEEEVKELNEEEEEKEEEDIIKKKKNEINGNGENHIVPVMNGNGHMELSEKENNSKTNNEKEL